MLDSPTVDKLYTLAYGQHRQQLDWLKRRITRPLGDWQYSPNPYVFRRYTAKLTGKLPSITITMPTEVME